MAQKMKKLPVKRDGTKVIFQARVSYVHLKEPWSKDPKDKKSYSVSAIIDKTADKDIVEAIEAAVKEAYEKGVAGLWEGARPNTESKNFRYPLKDGDIERGEDEAYAGKYFIGCNSSEKRQPGVCNRLKEPIDPDQVYSGCYCLLIVNFFPFNKGSKGIGAGLNAVMKLYDGDRLGGGGGSSWDDFDGIEGLDEVEDLDDL